MVKKPEDFYEDYKERKAEVNSEAEKAVKEITKAPTFFNNDDVVYDTAAAMHTKNRQEKELKRGEEAYRQRKFAYDVNKDPLFQQYLASAKRGGQNAMEDTVAKVAARTGGIAGSYAVSAGAGAYNDYMQSVNDVIPELEQLAYQKYQNELARDLKIMEMDEKKRIEDAQYNATLSTHQNEGRPFTDEEKAIIYANGGYITPEGDVIDAKGNRYKKGTKYEDDLYLQNSKEEGEKVSKLVAMYMAGADLGADARFLEQHGYRYINGKLYDPFGMEIQQRWKVEEVKDDSELKSAINALGFANANDKTLSDKYKDILSENGFYYDTKTKTWKNAEGVNALDFFGDTGTSVVGTEETVVQENSTPPAPTSKENLILQSFSTLKTALPGSPNKEIADQMISGLIKKGNTSEIVTTIDLLVKSGSITSDEASDIVAEKAIKNPEILNYI